MDDLWPRRPRVSRETRLLLVTAIVAVAALWVLARVRFPDRPAAPNPVQPLLTQLVAPNTFDDLAAEISQVQQRLLPLLVAFDPAPPGEDVSSRVARPRAALRTGDDVAVVLLDDVPGGGAPTVTEGFLGTEPASKLALVRVPGPPAPPPVPWPPVQIERPRYMMASDISAAALSMRPVFVGSLVPIVTPVWPGEIWSLPAQTDVTPGSFVFTRDALLVGLVVSEGNGLAIVPGETLLAETGRLLVPTVNPPGQLGIDVEPLTPPVAKATGSSAGVVVVRVDAEGPAAGLLAAGDVLEAADGETLWTPLHWETKIARVNSGQSITLRVRRAGATEEVPLTAAGLRTTTPSEALGVTLRSLSRTGSVVVRVEPGSTADRAGLAAGDIITRVADTQAPSPARIRRSFAAAAQGQAVLVTFTRGDAHRVTALEK